MHKIDSLKEKISKQWNTQYYEFSHKFGDDVLTIPKEDVIKVLSFLKAEGEFDYLMDVCGVDYPKRTKRFDVVYHFFNSKDGSRLRVKTQVGENESLPSAISIWRGADWFEREAYDMFGIRFDGHPNLRRILTHHQFVGHPLRKDYEADAQQHCTEPSPMCFDNEPGRPGDVLDTNLVPINIGPSILP